MKVHSNTTRGSYYTNPRKTHRLSAKEKRGMEMLAGCRTAPVSAVTK